MRRIWPAWFIALVPFLLPLTAVFAQPLITQRESIPQATVTINLTSTGFDPQEKTIEAGDSVTFQNQVAIPITLQTGIRHFVYLPFLPRPGNQGSGLSTLPASTAPSKANRLNGDGTVIPAGGSTTIAFPTAGTYTYYQVENPFFTAHVIVVEHQDFSLTPIPLSRSINAGKATTFTLTLAPVNGYDKPLTLSVTGLPAGVTPHWDTNPATPPASPILTLSTGPTVQQGAYPFTIQATDGTTTHSTQATLNIQPWADLSVTTLAADPDPVSIGSPVTISTRVTNLGPGSADSFSITWVIKNDHQDVLTSGSWPVTSLASAAYVDKTAQYTPSQAGSLTITIVADPAASLPDSNRTNNTLGKTFQFKDFTLAANDPTSHTIYINQSATYQIATGVKDGFASPVTLSVTNLPAGVSAGWDSNTATPPATQTLTLTADSLVDPDSYDLTVSGSGGGVTHTTGITLVVNARPDLSVQSVTLSTNPVAGGEPFDLSTQIANLGVGPAQTFTVAWRIVPLGQTDPVLEGAWTVDGGLAGSHNVTLTASSITAPTPGAYTVTVTVDPASAMPDPDRTNNMRTRELGVTGPLTFCGDITSDTTWAYATYVLTCDLTIDSGVTLTVIDGAVVKPANGGFITVNGTLAASGTTEDPVVFTSYRDDYHGGNTDGGSSLAGRGDWVAIHISHGGTGAFDHTYLDFGGGTRSGYLSNTLRSEGGTLTFTHSILESGAAVGIRTASDSPLSVTDSTIQDNSGRAIEITQNNGSVAPVIRNTDFFRNNDYALYFNINTATFDGSNIQNNTASDNIWNGIVLTGIFTGSSNLSGNSGVAYLMPGDVTVATDATLTIDPGAVVKLSAMVWVNGILNASGTALNPIVFTSPKDDTYAGDTNNDLIAVPAAGDWTAIHISAGATGSFDHTIMRYGGGPRSGYPSNTLRNDGGSLTLAHSTVEWGAAMGLRVASNSTLTVTDSFFEDNNGRGIDFTQTGGSTAPAISHTAFNRNTDYAVFFTLNSTAFNGSAIQNNSAAGNTWNGIGLGGTLIDISRLSGNPGMAYLMPGDVSVETGATLAIDPGAVIKLSNMLGVSGTLNAPGTLENPVVFTSPKDDTYGGDTNNSTAPPAPGDWTAVHISAGATGSFDHAILRYGGGPRAGYPSNTLRNDGGSLTLAHSTLELGFSMGLRVASGSTLTISDCTFQDNAGRGIDFTQTGGSTAPTISSTAFNDNTEYAIFLNLNATTFDGSNIQNNTTGGNIWNGIGVSGTFTGASNLSGNPGTDYLMPVDVFVDAGASLTIHPGAVIKLSAMLWVSGTLNAPGTAGNPIVFTSPKDDTYGGDADNAIAAPAPGDWTAIHISATGSFDHAIMRYGGGPRAGYPANTLRNDGGSLTLAHSMLEKGASIGMRVASGSTLTISDCIFQDNNGRGVDFTQNSGSTAPVISNTAFNRNTDYAVFFTLNSAAFNGSAIQNNSAAGNAWNGIGLGGTLIDISRLSGNPGMAYLMPGDVSVAAGATLTIDPGAVIKLSNMLGVSGTLNAPGTLEKPVVFTSPKDDTYGGDADNATVAPAPGDWTAVHISAGATGSFDHAILRYGGGPRSGYPANTLRNDGGLLTLAHSTLELGFSMGLRVASGSTLTISDCTFQDNNGRGIDFTQTGGSTAPTISNTAFNRNTDYAVFFTLNSTAFDGSNIQNNTTSGNSWNGIGLGGTLIDISRLSGNPGTDYLMPGDVSVAAGATLTIDPGAVIKLSNMLGVSGTLNAPGTLENPIVFTSPKDDTYGGDADNTIAAPAPGDWTAIHISAGATGSFDHAIMRYGGGPRAGYPSNTLRNDGGLLTLAHSNLEYSAAPGIRQNAGALSVSYTTIAHSAPGIFIADSSQAPLLDHVIFSSNTTGLEVYGNYAPTVTTCSFVGNATYGLFNGTGHLTDATNSWWGDPSGPYHSTHPTGLGNAVSDNVLFNPWLSAAP